MIALPAPRQGIGNLSNNQITQSLLIDDEDDDNDDDHGMQML